MAIDTTLDRPCRCYGAPINPVWGNGRSQPQTAFECGRCGETWPMGIRVVPALPPEPKGETDAR